MGTAPGRSDHPRPGHGPGPGRAGLGVVVLWALTAVGRRRGTERKVAIAVGPACSSHWPWCPTAAMFVAAGGDQPTGRARRQAAGWAAVLGAPTRSAWWPTPASASMARLGVAPRLGRRAPPLTDPRPLALLPIVALTVLLGAWPCTWPGAATWAPASGRPGRPPRPAPGSCPARPVWPSVWPDPPPPAGPSPSPPRPYWKASSPNKGGRVDDVGHRRTRLLAARRPRRERPGLC